MEQSNRPSAAQGPWTSLWVVALVSLLAQMWMCQFFSFGERVPVSLDVNPSNLWALAYHFPPTGSFHVLNWLGQAYLPQPLHPFSLAAALLSPWWFFTIYAPIMATLALLAMAAFLREFELSRPAALFGGVVYAWQGDLLPFVYPGHYAYIATWFFFAVGAWGALRAQRTRHWAYGMISGICCGLMVSLQPDRGAIASVLIGVLYLASVWQRSNGVHPTLGDQLTVLRNLLLCVIVAAMVALAPLLALFQGNIVGVKLAGSTDREQTYKLVTQFSLGPSETLTYLVPGFFGWSMNTHDGPYWGWIGEWPDWPKNHQGSRNLNLAISTTGTAASVLALLGVVLLVWEGLLGPGRLTQRQRFFGRVLLAFGFITLILSWGWHTPLYRPLFDYLPLMDKWRNPLKWLEMTNFALVVLSALGVQHLMASLAADAPDVKIVRQRLAWFTTGFLIVLGVGLALCIPMGIIISAMLQAEGCDPGAVANMMSTMHVSMLWAFIIILLFWLSLRVFWQPEKLRGMKPVNPFLHRLWQRSLEPENLPLTLALVMSTLAAVQLGWVAEQFIQPVPLQVLTASNPLLEALRSEGDTVRVAVSDDDPVLNGLLQNQFMAMDISCLEIAAASRIPDDFNTFLRTLGDDQPRLLFLAGVKNIVVPEPSLDQLRQDPGTAPNIDHADGYTLQATASPDTPSHAMVGLKDYLSKATFVPNVEFFTSDDALLKRLKDSAWFPRETILLERPVTITVPPAAGASKTSDHVDLKTYTPTEIEIEAQTSRSGFILINDQYDADWRVQVNGQTVPLLRADYILRAVAVPAGESKITMHYAANYHVGRLSLPTVIMNNFSDGVMLGAWLIAGLALRGSRRCP